MPRVTDRHDTMRLAFATPDRDARIPVHDPWTGGLVGSVPKATAQEVSQALDVAAAYRPTLSRNDRAEILKRTAALIEQRREVISDLITSESGLCKKDTLYETNRARDVFALAGTLCLADDGQIFAGDVTPEGKARRILTHRAPLSAISAITPFNHPLNQVAHKVAPSIATNNCMVLKPSEKTPLTALLLADLLREAGLPPEMVQIVTGDPAEVGEVLISHPKAELITFTGGVAIGKAIAARAGYRRLVLELGGNDPLIVLADADLDRAADLAVQGATRNSGQRCTAVKRILVEASVAEAFVPKVVDRALAIRVGDPMDPQTDMGTVIDEAAARAFEDKVAQAVAAGAQALHAPPRQGALFPPTVLDHVPETCPLVAEETFGPVVPILRCHDLDDIIRVANATPYGLSSGVCTDRWDAIRHLANALNVGALNVWEVPGYRTEMSPFGGIKDSGLGYKEGVAEAMKAFTTLKTLSLPWPV